MNSLLSTQSIEAKLISIKDQQVLIDRDVVQLYRVATRYINKAVKNNPDKFPGGYTIEHNASERKEVVENFHHLQSLKYVKTNPKAFTGKKIVVYSKIKRIFSPFYS